jgi:hypothetical protein
LAWNSQAVLRDQQSIGTKRAPQTLFVELPREANDIGPGYPVWFSCCSGIGSGSGSGSGDNSDWREAAANAPARQEASVRIQSSISFLLPGLTNESEEAQKLRDRAKRLVYEMASHECDILRETLAKDCKLETVNSNLARQQYGNQQEGYNVNGQLSLVVTLK